ncbi:MAG: S8 family serine peptidase [Fibrobacter sp.]|nr:S8 family serine peptidase [Fibrobacter sp.]
MKSKVTALLAGSVLSVCALAADKSAEPSVAVSSSQLNVVNAKTDVLGRHNTNYRATPQAFVKNDLTKPKVLMKTTYPEELSIPANYGAFSYIKNSSGSMAKSYSLNGISGLSEAEYKARIQEVEDADPARFSYVRSNNVTYGNTATHGYNYISGLSTSKCTGKETCTESATLDKIYDSHGNLSRTVKENIDYHSYVKIIQDRGYYTHAVRGGYRGRNIGIYFDEGDMPQEGFVPEAQLKIENDCGKSYTGQIIHGTNVARILNKVAEKATLYGYNHRCKDPIFDQPPHPANAYYKNPQIFIGNHSYGDPVYEYNLTSQRIDDYVYDTRVVEFASAGDAGARPGAQLSPTALGVNVITVGAVHNDLTYHETSSWRNSTYRNTNNKYVKPEIANFSDIMFPNDAVPKINDKVLEPHATQTSSATPFTAATVADLMDRFPFYKWHPEVVKALLITSSVTPIKDAATHDTDNEGKYAMGVPNAQAMFQYNRSRFWNGNNNEFFENDYIRFKETNITKGKRYRIAIAWLSKGEYVYENGVLPQDIDLRVYQNGKKVGESNSSHNSFELVDFTATSSKDLEIEILRYRNNGGRVLLGYNMVEIQ